MCEDLLEKFDAYQCLEQMMELKELTLPAVLLLARFSQAST